jgi:Tol biopolymer transport system component
MYADGSGATRLTDNPAREGFPTWSPDGRHIAFMSSRDENYEVYVMTSDGSVQSDLTNDLAFDGFPAWSPDGQQIAFLSDRDGGYRWYLMAPDGSHVDARFPISMAEGYSTGWFSGAWSPDGQAFAYTTVEATPFDEGEPAPLIKIEALSPGEVACTFRWLQSLRPVWSPDGTRLAFNTSYQPDNHLDIGIVAVFAEGGCYAVFTELFPDVRVTTEPGPDIVGSWTDQYRPSPSS